MKSPRALPWFFAIAAMVVHVASACWHIRHGSLNADEGFYAVATRAVAQGELPYRDFGFTQPPLVLYANALPLQLAGFGLFPQRAVNGLWAAAALGIAGWWLATRTRWECAIGLVAIFSLSAPWMYFIHLGKTYGLTTLLVMLAAWAFLAVRAGPKRNIALGVLAALGVGTRLPAAPFFAVLGLFALWPGRRPTRTEFLAAAGSFALVGAALVLPFWLADAASAKFWVIDFHRLSVPFKDWRLSWQEILTLAPAVWLLSGAAFVLLVIRRRMATREAGVMLAAATALAANLLPGGVYEEYGVPFLLPLATASIAIIYDLMPTGRHSITVGIITLAAGAHFLAAPILLRGRQPPRPGFPSAWLTPNAPSYNPDLPTQLIAARSVVANSLAPDAPFIGPNIILAAETGRRVPPELRMGPFSFTLEMEPAEAARRHLATHEVLDQWFTRPDVTVLGFFKRRELNYGWSMPTFGQLREDIHQQWFAPIRRDFTPAFESGDDFLVLVRNPMH